VENGVEHRFIGIFKKIHRSPEYPEMIGLQVGHKVRPGIPFFKEKESFFVIDTLAEVVAPHPFSILVEPDSEAIVCDNSMRFSEPTFICMVSRII
jgi:hypothetical protein